MKSWYPAIKPLPIDGPNFVCGLTFFFVLLDIILNFENVSISLNLWHFLLARENLEKYKMNNVMVITRYTKRIRVTKLDY